MTKCFRTSTTRRCLTRVCVCRRSFCGCSWKETPPWRRNIGWRRRSGSCEPTTGQRCLGVPSLRLTESSWKHQFLVTGSGTATFPDSRGRTVALHSSDLPKRSESSSASRGTRQNKDERDVSERRTVSFHERWGLMLNACRHRCPAAEPPPPPPPASGFKLYSHPADSNL